eukprot:913684_1
MFHILMYVLGFQSETLLCMRQIMNLSVSEMHQSLPFGMDLIILQTNRLNWMDLYVIHKQHKIKPQGNVRVFTGFLRAFIQSVKLFKQFTNDPAFDSTKMVLLFNKTDILKKKIAANDGVLMRSCENTSHFDHVTLTIGIGLIYLKQCSVHST